MNEEFFQTPRITKTVTYIVDKDGKEIEASSLEEIIEEPKTEEVIEEEAIKED